MITSDPIHEAVQGHIEGNRVVSIIRGGVAPADHLARVLQLAALEQGQALVITPKMQALCRAVQKYIERRP